MARKKYRPCVRCGRPNGRLDEICAHCKSDDDLKSLEKRHCALCGDEISRERRSAANRSHYCTCECASAVREAGARFRLEVTRAVRNGVLPHPKTLRCVDCGKPASEYEHRRYLQPLDVVPTCCACNQKRGAALDVADAVLAHNGADGDIREFMKPIKERWREHRASLFARQEPANA